MKKLSEMTDEERYGKIGAEIRRLDPEAYKNRPRSAEGNLKLLEELRSRAKTKPTVDFAKEGKVPTVDFAKEGRVKPKTGAISAGVEPDDTPSQAMRDEVRYKVRNQRAPGRPGGNRDKLTEQGYKRGGMPDLTGDGKITRADVLKGRGVFRKGGAVKSSASKRADGIAVKGKTRGKFV